jgi:hypothetical protein
VLLYGQSLLLSLVANSLAQQPGLRVAQARTWTEARGQLADDMPGALIFDLAESCETHVLPLLLKSPHLTLIGLDQECNQAVLISGHAAHSLTLDQIREIVEAR